MAEDKKWEGLTKEEKRDRRFKYWIEAKNIQFKSPEAKKLYQERATRFAKAYQLQIPDRVPVRLPAGSFAAYYAGYDLYTVMYDLEKSKEASLKFLNDFRDDMDSFAGVGSAYGAVSDIMDYKFSKWPGHGLSIKATSHQFVERINMRADEYDDLIRDPSDWALRVFIPRTVGALEPFRKLQDLSDLLAHPNSFVTPAASPDVRAAFQALIDAGLELEKRQKITLEVSREVRSAGFPAMGGGSGMAPFDVMGDFLRGTNGIFTDMYRQPDKLHEAMDKIADLMIARGKETAKNINAIMMSFPLHKGDDTFMSDKQFETFYWPSLKKVILAFIEEGLMVSLFAEGAYNNRLKQITDLPKGWVNWTFDRTDMKKAKEILGSTCCISGNIPASLMITGTAQEVKDYCRKLIEACAPGGGYILAGGCSATETNAENLRAIMQTAKEYGVY